MFTDKILKNAQIMFQHDYLGGGGGQNPPPPSVPGNQYAPWNKVK